MGAQARLSLRVYELFFLNQFRLSGLLATWITLDELYGTIWFLGYFCVLLFIPFFHILSPHRLQLFKRMLQCFAAEISPGYPSACDHQQLFCLSTIFFFTKKTTYLYNTDQIKPTFCSTFGMVEAQRGRIIQYFLKSKDLGRPKNDYKPWIHINN